MSHIISIAEYHRRREQQELEATQEGCIYEASDHVLDAILESFEDGICVGILNNKVQVSSTMDDVDHVIWLLEEALQNLYNEGEEG